MGKLMDIIDNNEIEVITSVSLINEIRSVVTRPKFKRYFSSSDVQTLMDWLAHTTIIEINSITPRCRDPKDDYLLELAVQAKAIYLVSGDADLLVLGHVENCQILTVQQFCDQMGYR